MLNLTYLYTQIMQARGLNCREEGWERNHGTRESYASRHRCCIEQGVLTLFIRHNLGVGFCGIHYVSPVMPLSRFPLGQGTYLNHILM